MAVYLLLFRGVGGATQLPVARLLQTVAQVCAREFDYRKPVYAPTLEEWNALIAANPFPGPADGRHLHAAWCDGTPTGLARLRALAVAGEGIEAVGNVCYLHTPHGFGTSKLAEKFDAWLGVPNTARNWNTVLKLRDLAEAAR